MHPGSDQTRQHKKPRRLANCPMRKAAGGLFASHYMVCRGPLGETPSPAGISHCPSGARSGLRIFLGRRRLHRGRLADAVAALEAAALEAGPLAVAELADDAG